MINLVTVKQTGALVPVAYRRGSVMKFFSRRQNALVPLQGGLVA